MTTMRQSFPNRGSQRGFTLTEVMIALALASILVTAILTTVVTLSRGSMNLARYADLNQEARQGLQTFARDIRQASAITWNSERSISVTVNGSTITYSLDSDDGTGQWAFRRAGRPLIQAVDPDSFRLTGFRIVFAESGTESEATAEARPVPLSLDDLALASRETKQLQLELRSVRQSAGSPQASNTVVSARYILRNKRITS